MPRSRNATACLRAQIVKAVVLLSRYKLLRLVLHRKWNECGAKQGGGFAVVPDQSSSGVVELATTLMCNNTPGNIEGSYIDLGGNLLCNCPGDFDGNGIVAGLDLSRLLGVWGACPEGTPCIEDINGDGQVDGADLSALLAAWGVCP